MNKIPEIMQYLLKHNQLTANALAVALKIPTPTIHRIATGDVQDPRISTISAIANYFGVTLEQLMGQKPLCKKNTDHSQIPLLTLKDAFQHTVFIKNSENFLEMPHEKKHVFAVILQNDFYEPHFLKNEYLLIDPTIEPETGDYVLIYFIKNKNTALLKYNKEGKKEFLYSLKNKKNETAYQKSEHKLIGVITETIRKLKF